MDRSQVQVLDVGLATASPACSVKARDGPHLETGLTAVYQRGSNDCGPAALATVAAHHGRRLNDVDLHDCRLERDGTDLLTLKRAAERLGFKAEGVRAAYDAIGQCDLPAIAHMRCVLSRGHFVVVHRWNPGYVTVADPAAGVRTFPRTKFLRRWSGYLLI